jgi:hypothetical protein
MALQCAVKPVGFELTEDNFEQVWQNILSQRVLQCNDKHIADCPVGLQSEVKEDIAQLVGFIWSW